MKPEFVALEPRAHTVEPLQLDLKERAVRSGASVVLAQLGTATVSLAAVVVLARLLQPADFGLVAMALPAMIIASGLRNFGLDLGLIHRHDLAPALLDAIGRRLLRLNVVIALLLAALAPVLAWFYGESRLIGITLVFAAGIFFLGLGATQETLLKRQLRFGVLSLINFSASLAGAFCAIALALASAGYWALVAQTVVMFAWRGLLVRWKCDWRPHPGPPDRGHDELLRELREYGRDLTVTRLWMLGSNYIDRIAVGWLGGPAVLGFYENGRRLGFLTLETLYGPLLDVAVAGLSRTTADQMRFRRAAAKVVQLVLALILPWLALAFIEMRPATLLVFGDKWTPSIPFARLLVLAAFAHSITRTLMWLLLASGRTERQRRWFAWQAVLTLGAVLAGAWLGGAIGVAAAVALINWILAAPAIIYSLHDSAFSSRDFLRAAARPVLLSLAAAAVLFLLETRLPHWPSSPALQCLGAAVVFGVLYVGGWIASPGGLAAGRQMIELLSAAGWRRRSIV